MKRPNHTSLGILTIVFFAIIIGCGGGGASPGGTSTTGTSSSGTSTSGTATSTTGSTTSSTSTTGTSTSGTTTGTTTGSTTSTTGSTATTTSTTGTTTSGTTTSSTGSTAGFLPQNAILFVSHESPSKLKSIKADGSGETVLATFDNASIAAVAKNPNTNNSFAFAKITMSGATPTVRLYLGNSTLSTTGALLLTTTVFDSIGDIQFSPSGDKVLFSGLRAIDQNFKLFSVPIAGGAISIIDDADDFQVCPNSSSPLVTYSKSVTSSVSEIFTANYQTNGSITKVSNLNSTSLSPTFNRAGTLILFSSVAAASGRNDLFTIPTSGGTTTQVTSTSNTSEFGAMFNEDGTKISYIGVDVNPLLTGLYVCNADGSSSIQLVGSTSLGFTTYFTDSNGRSFGGINGWHFSLRRGNRY